MWMLIPLTVLPQLLMGDRGELRVFGPDTSTGWVPEWHVLAYYAVFFVFGSLLFDRSGRSGRSARRRRSVAGGRSCFR